MDAASEPVVLFGRYSDNNKPVAKVNRWTEADSLFKEKNIPIAWMPFLITCGMMPLKMWNMRETVMKEGFSYSRDPKLSGVVLINTRSRLKFPWQICPNLLSRL